MSDWADEAAREIDNQICCGECLRHPQDCFLPEDSIAEIIRRHAAPMIEEKNRLNLVCENAAQSIRDFREIVDGLKANDATVYKLLIEFFHGNIQPGGQAELYAALSGVFNLVRLRAEQAEARCAKLEKVLSTIREALVGDVDSTSYTIVLAVRSILAALDSPEKEKANG